MHSKLKLAVCLLHVIAATAFGFGLMWLFATDLLPIQKDFLGESYAQLSPGAIDLFLILYRSIGGSYVLFALMLFLMAMGPFKRGDEWTRRMVLLLVVVFAIPFAWGAWRISSPTVAVPILMVILAIVAHQISRTPESGGEQAA